MNDKERILDRLTQGKKTRFVAFGSSNTDRRIHGLHWFDWLDLGIKHTYGRVHHSINAGVGGDTTAGLLERFDEDVAFYQPHVVFITIGGNDANPEKGISAQVYRANLQRLVAMIRDLRAIPVLQTYYAADIPNLDEVHGRQFLQFMDIVRETAAEKDALLVDHHKHWEPLRLAYPQKYKALMMDALHVNPLGNMVMGLDLIRMFGVQLAQEQRDFCTEGLVYQRFLDELAVSA